MENIVNTLLTLLAAVLVAVGGPANVVESPDRPAIVQAPAAPASNSIGVYDTRGTIEDVRGSEIVVDGEKFSIERETEIVGELRVGGKVDVEAKHAQNGGSVALKIRIQNADDSSSNSADDLSPKGKDDRSSYAEKETEIEIETETETEKESLDSSSDRSWDDSPDAAWDESEQDKSDDKTQTATSVKPEDSKSPEHSGTQVETSDDKSEQQDESRDDSSKSSDSQESHSETESSDDHRSDDHESEDHESEDLHD